MDLEVRDNKMCKDCFHYLGDGDRCEIGIVCFNGSPTCQNFIKKEESNNARISNRSN